MELRTDQMDRACGVLLGRASGDALGVPYEFATPPAPGELAEMRGGGLGDYTPGEWSDDTQMAACIALVSATGAGLISGEALDAIAEGSLSWAREGADIGVQTSTFWGRAATVGAVRASGSPPRRMPTPRETHAAPGTAP
jgi:ADP-ribosylglycohydrolase